MNMDLVSVKIVYPSGETAFGPEIVPASLSIKELKTMFDADDVKTISLADRVLEDDDSIKELDLAQSELCLVACTVPEHALRSQKAKALLDAIQPQYLNEMTEVSKPVDIIPLCFCCAFLTLTALYGEET
eukprot:TRINITY_DN40298_c0_g1_i1.p2 TRINITY_DN40298_c0_g1~~TRINITY_DN40298_c0_g1_i1.p2  ORF type:complete len:144 (-),score=19.03 TRINITY_DN40298_c0_g1_i1:378-767(-)